jgi:hypothetical protein
LAIVRFVALAPPGERKTAAPHAAGLFRLLTTRFRSCDEENVVAAVPLIWPALAKHANRES